MKKDDKSLLLAFSDAVTSLPALDYGVWLAEQLQVPVSLLGIVEIPSRRYAIEKVIESTAMHLERLGIPYQTKITTGNTRQVICQQAIYKRHLSIFGPFGRPILRRYLRGRSFRRILAEIGTPVLYTKNSHKHLEKILVCMGGLGYAKSAAGWAFYLAQKMQTSITLLHVVEPITYEYPTAHVIQDHLDDILHTDTPQGQNLREAMKKAQEQGIGVNFQVRQGGIIHVITTEINTQGYDLVVMGSPYSTSSLRHLFMPNVTAEIAESLDIPVLTVSSGQDCIFG
jgi:nucleotide-binding universal stress UspA family protein